MLSGFPSTVNEELMLVRRVQPTTSEALLRHDHRDRPGYGSGGARDQDIS